MRGMRRQDGIGRSAVWGKQRSLILPQLGTTWPQALTLKGRWVARKGTGTLYGHNNHCSCASRDQRSNQISSCRDLNPITCRGQGKEFFFPEEPQDWLNSQQGGLALPWRIALLATAQKQGDTASGWMGLVGPFYCSLAECLPGRMEKLRESLGTQHSGVPGVVSAQKPLWECLLSR